MAMYTVVVGNIGMVYQGIDLKHANKDFREYVALSKSAHHSATGEPVTLMMHNNTVENFDGIVLSHGNGEIVREYRPRLRFPTIRELTPLLRALKLEIRDDYRADDADDDTPSMLVTIGADSVGGWDYQTGDNSYSGPCYHYPYWGVVVLTRRSDCRALARECVDQLRDAQSY